MDILANGLHKNNLKSSMYGKIYASTGNPSIVLPKYDQLINSPYLIPLLIHHL